MQTAPMALALASAAFGCGGAAAAGQPAAASPPSSSCSRLMPPAPPGLPARFQVRKNDPAHDICMPGTSDGAGALALQTLHQYQPGGSQAWFVAADASRFNPVSLPSATFTGQAEGFEGASWTAQPTSAILLYDDAGRLRAGSPVLKSFPQLVDDPRGGVVVANLPDALHVETVEAYDSSAHLRWHLSTPPRGLVALGVDLGGNTLLVLDGAPESGARAGLWIDAQGNATPPFPIGALSRSAGATLFARIGQGFFVRQTLSSGNEWVGQLDALSSTLTSIPDWLAPEKKALIHVIKGGAGYALLPPPGVAVSPCAQQVSIVDPSGLDCGSLSFPLGPDSCVTDAITLGRDGTVIQLLPAALESQAAIPSPSCTWQWWSAFLK